jgi:hypothetical protein
MAIYHLAVKTGSRSNKKSARAKYEYIAREARYSRQHSDVLLAESGNMPAWAGGELGTPRDYWLATDAFERANGRLYKEVEFALPIELSDDAKIELARHVARHITGEENLPYTLTVHNNHDNPHAHIMVSERVNDGQARPVSRWFSRHDKNDPKSGARKTEKLKPKMWFEELRKEVERSINAALSIAGVSERVDCRSLKAQGIDRLPTIHEGSPDAPGHTIRRAHNATIRAENTRRAAQKKNLAQNIGIGDWVSVGAQGEISGRVMEITDNIITLLSGKRKLRINRNKAPIKKISQPQRERQQEGTTSQDRTANDLGR